MGVTRGVVDIPVVGEALETLVVGVCLTEIEVEGEILWWGMVWSVGGNANNQRTTSHLYNRPRCYAKSPTAH